jgi:hypothetical protein
MSCPKVYPAPLGEMPHPHLSQENNERKEHYSQRNIRWKLQKRSVSPKPLSVHRQLPKSIFDCELEVRTDRLDLTTPNHTLVLRAVPPELDPDHVRDLAYRSMETNHREDRIYDLQPLQSLADNQRCP